MDPRLCHARHDLLLFRSSSSPSASRVSLLFDVIPIGTKDTALDSPYAEIYFHSPLISFHARTEMAFYLRFNYLASDLPILLH